MIKINTRKNKSAQYVVGATVAIIILGAWISLPLMNSSSMSSSAAGNPFSSRVSDISSLGSDISQEGGAPGSALSGEMINNPATSGEEILSSLFQSGPSPEDAAQPSASADVGPAPAPGGAEVSGPGGGSAPAGRPGGKLAAVASLSGSNSNSMTAGSNHGKFFGSGNQKSDFAPAVAADLKKSASGPDTKKSVASILNSTLEQSKLAARTGNLADARGGASSAFGGTAKAASSDLLKGSAEESSAVSGLALGEATDNLKKNDPTLNKSKVTPPAPTPPKSVKDPNEEMKQMIIKMFLQAALGCVFGA